MLKCIRIKVGNNLIARRNVRIDSYFRAHFEYKRTDGGLKIPRSALGLGVYSQHAHVNRN